MKRPNQTTRRAKARSHTSRLRLLCLAEAATLLALLFIAVPLKHLADYPAGVSLMGPLHGFVFVVFGWHVVQAISMGGITAGTGGKLLLAACVPFGGIYSWWSLR